MDRNQLEIDDKERAYRLQQACQEQPKMNAGVLIARPSLIERIQSQRYRAEEQSRNKENLMELEELLHENPKIARILDLLERVKD